MKKQGTIVIVAPYFPPQGGGLERYTHEIGRRLHKDHGWRIAVITSGERNGNDVKEDLDGLTVYRLSYRFKLSNTPFSLGWFKKIRRILKAENPDVVNIHMPVPGIGDVAALLARKIPVVVTYHAGSMLKGILRLDILIWLYEHWPLRFVLNSADRIVCSSDYLRQDFLRRYTYKSLTITPGVDTKVFKPEANRGANKKPASPIILFVGGLNRSEKHKGLKTFLDAARLLMQDQADFSLMIVGDGDMKPNYEKCAAELGLERITKFTGRLVGENLAMAYRKASMLVLPTLKPAESFPMVLIEAMASEKPVIGTNTGGTPWVIDHEKNGLLVPYNDLQALVSAMRRLLENPLLAKQMGKAGRKKVMAQCDWATHAARYDSLFRSVRESKPAVTQLVSYYPPHLGGMEIVAEEISLALARRGYPVTVLTSNIGAEDNFYNDGNYRVKRLRSTEIAHTPLLWSLPFRLLLLPKGSILHLHISQAGIPEIALLAAKLRRLELVAHFHLDVGPSGPMGILLPFYKKYFLGWVLRGADKVVVFSKGHAEAVQKMYRVKESNLAIVPNGVGEEFFSRKKRTGLGSRLRLLYVGRLSKQKRVERLVQAMAIVKIPAHLTIVGDGEDRIKLEVLTKELGLANVSFGGKKYGDVLRSHYRDADAFVISSDIEGMPLAVLEAMAAGLPIIGSDVPGIRELVNGVGMLVSHPSAETFAGAIEKLSDQPEKLQSFSARSLKKAGEYSWENVAERIETVYQEILR